MSKSKSKADLNQPRRSTTHRERFYHFDVTSPENGSLAHVSNITVFIREDSPNSNFWNASVAACHSLDQFSRKRGRTVARRKYFLTDADERYGYSVFVDGADSSNLFAFAEAVANKFLSRHAH